MADSPLEKMGVVGSWKSNQPPSAATASVPQCGGGERPEGLKSEFNSPKDTWAVSDQVCPCSDSLLSPEVCMTLGSSGLAHLVFGKRLELDLFDRCFFATATAY